VGFLVSAHLREDSARKDEGAIVMNVLFDDAKSFVRGGG
jgi:hypothetical protein